ncbi:MAG: undecaprenyldiphospho-muramoylpentapeptide beta-N-acetylglucosaminyltransferase [Janthinobacterium lividum]
MAAEASQDSLRVVIAGGGTGGHVIPALAIARELRDRHLAEVRLIGTSRGIETKLVPEAGFPLELIQVGQLANVSMLTRLRTSAGLPLAVRQCVRFLRGFRPHVVLGVGGYASGPAMLAALLLRLPTMVYEPNAVPGMVNRRVGRFVGAAAVAFQETAPYFRRAVLTGVPVRREIVDAGPLQVYPPRLLVTAGSNGARVFNETMPLIMGHLLAAVPGLSVVHQTGERAFQATEAAYREAGLTGERLQVCAFLSDMPAQLDRATLVLSRSGSTVAELAAAGRPSLLVPFPRAADDHQTKNALAMVRGGAAEMLPESSLMAEGLLQHLSALLLDPERLLRMSADARAMSRPNALGEIAALAESLGNSQDRGLGTV